MNSERQTIFDRLRAKETEGHSLHELIVNACDAGNALVDALDPVNVRKAAQLLMGHGHGLHGGLLILMADAQERALDRAYPTNGNGSNGSNRSAA